MPEIEDVKRYNSNTSLKKEQQSLENSRHEEKSIDHSIMSNRDRDRERDRRK
jgi:hypothetical protein